MGPLNLKPLAVFGLLLLPIACAPLAAADGGLTVLLLVSPNGKGVGDTVDINVFTYVNGALVDADTLDVVVDILHGGNTVNMTNVSAGKYHASYQIQQNDVHAGSMDITVTADAGLLSDVNYGSYDVTGAGASTGWELTIRGVATPGAAGLWVKPGTNLTFEARSYLNGNLQDGGQINFSATYLSGTTPTTDTLTVSKVQDGVYQANLSVPADLAATRAYAVTAKMGTGVLDPSESTSIQAHPFNVFSAVTASTNTSATLRVQAGDSSPLAAATVTLTGEQVTLSPPYYTTIGPFTATTDANGAATVNATWTAGASLATIWTLSVSSGGKTADMAVALGAAQTQAWTPHTPLSFGCDVNLQTDPATFALGQATTMKFRVTNNGSAVVSSSVARYIWREGEGQLMFAGNTTTDASGNFSETITVPANWTDSDVVHVAVVCPNFSSGEDLLQGDVGTTPGPFGSGKVTVSASGRLGGNVDVTATYGGSNALTGAQAFAAIMPGNLSQVTGVGLGGGGLTAIMTRSGSSFTGSIAVPAWLGEGDYTVFVLITNIGATSTTSDQTVEGNATTLHLTPQGSTGGNNGGGGKGFIPGLDAAMTVVAAVAAGAIALARRRR